MVKFRVMPEGIQEEVKQIYDEGKKRFSNFVLLFAALFMIIFFLPTMAYIFWMSGQTFFSIMTVLMFFVAMLYYKIL